MDYALTIIPALLKGTNVTYTLFFSTLILAIPWGLMLALLGLTRFRLFKVFVTTYTWIFRGTPLLLQVLFIYYGLPILGLRLDRMTAAILTFALNYAAYFAEIFRGGIQSIDKGQYEGSHVLGLSYTQTMKRIILPQMAKRVIPPMGNEIITLIKDSALVFAIGLSDVIRHAQTAAGRDFRIDAFVYAAVFYLVNTFILTWVFKKIEQRFAYYD